MKSLAEAFEGYIDIVQREFRAGREATTSEVPTDAVMLGIIRRVEQSRQAGTIVGAYTDTQGVSHNFLYSNGIYTTINAPANFSAEGIDNLGQIVGYYTDASGNYNGFVSPSPEPGSLALFGGGVLFLALTLRFKRTSNELEAVR